MKLDMGSAWDDAVTLLKNNAGLVATVAGLFFFLPNLAIGLLFPEAANPEPADIPQGADLATILKSLQTAMGAEMQELLPYTIGLSVLQFVGTLCVLALFSRRVQPTVGEALATGLRGTPSYFVTQLLFGIGFGVIAGSLIALAAAITPFLLVFVAPAVIVGVIYVAIKLLLCPTIIAMEGELNPITVMKRSWSLTKGNSLRIFAFILVLALIAGLIFLIATAVLTAVFVAMGEPVAHIGIAFTSSVMSTILATLFVAVYAAIHRQLTHDGGKGDAEVFA